MEYLINGQKNLKGTVQISGAKNAALKLIIAALLAQGSSRIRNVPRIRDIFAILDIINYLGGSARFINEHTVEVKNTLKSYKIPLEIAARTRTSIMLIAPLLHQFGQAIIANPGGCRLGERPVDRLMNSLKLMGAKIEYRSEDGYYYARLVKSLPANIPFAKKSHTGTELAIMFASRIAGKTVIGNAAQEPEIDDLIKFLNHTGAKIKRIKEDIVVVGKNELKGTEVSVQPDRIEAVTFIVLSALFGGNIKVKGLNIQTIAPFLKTLSETGINYQYQPTTKLFKLEPIRKIKPVSVMTAPHPGFLTDWQPLWVLLMTQAEGESIVHETVFEDRFRYIQDLRHFGAKVRFFQPQVEHPEALYQFNNFDPAKHRQQAVRINGPVKLHNAYATMTDIRAGACLVIAALVAKGKSVINGAEQIERGYEDLTGKLTRLGADIQAAF